MELPDSKRDKEYLKSLLTQLRDGSPQVFQTLLRRCNSYKGEDPGGVLKALAGFEILESDSDGGYRPRYASFCISDLWFITDTPQRPNRDSVFPLYPESVFFVNRMNISHGAKALDICTGCGIYAAFATRFTDYVTAIDINPRALDFARYNLGLNGIEDRVELLKGDLLEPVTGRTFDYISANPPFEPTPPEAFNYIHSDGGKDGLDTVRRLMSDVVAHLSDNGRFEMVTFSLGGDSGLQITNECYPQIGTVGTTEIVYPPVTLKSFASRFKSVSVQSWIEELCSYDLDKLYLLLVTMTKGQNTNETGRWEINTRYTDVISLIDWTNPQL